MIIMKSPTRRDKFSTVTFNVKVTLRYLSENVAAIVNPVANVGIYK